MNITSPNKTDIDSIIRSRKESLHSLQPSLSKKLYYSLEQRIEDEREQWYGLLNIATKKQATREQYSYVLDSFYFEQKLMQ